MGRKPADVMIALHARRSHASIARFAAAFPRRPLILMLTGTDLYADIRVDASARLSLKLATRLVVLQQEGLAELAPRLRAKARVIYQSTRTVRKTPPLKSCFEVCVSGHLRDVKDPFRLAAALGHLPAPSRISAVQIGGAMNVPMKQAAQRWMRREPRYRWMRRSAAWRGVEPSRAGAADGDQFAHGRRRQRRYRSTGRRACPSSLRAYRATSACWVATTPVIFLSATSAHSRACCGGPSPTRRFTRGSNASARRGAP